MGINGTEGDASREIVEGLFTASSDFIALVDPEGTVTRANATAEKMLGLAEGGVAGRRFDSLFIDEDAGRARSLIARVLSRGKVPDDDLWLAGPDFQAVPLGVSGFSLRDREGNAVGVCFVGRDETEDRALVDRLTMANERLQDLNAMKSEYVGMVSHEIKNPLSVVYGMVRALLDEPDTGVAGQAREFLEICLRKTNEIRSLIDDLLNLTRIETGKIELDLTSFDLKALLDEAVADMRPEAERAKVKLSLRAVEGLPLLTADRDMIRQVLTNFISNGIKYNRESGVLDVSVKPQATAVTVTFTDEGHGIPPQDRKKLFRRFFRAPDARRRDIPGTGLGLSIVKAIVDRHNGTIEVESEAGKGSVFSVRLPWRL